MVKAPRDSRGLFETIRTRTDNRGDGDLPALLSFSRKTENDRSPEAKAQGRDRGFPWFPNLFRVSQDHQTS